MGLLPREDAAPSSDVLSKCSTATGLLSSFPKLGSNQERRSCPIDCSRNARFCCKPPGFFLIMMGQGGRARLQPMNPLWSITPGEGWLGHHEAQLHPRAASKLFLPLTKPVRIAQILWRRELFKGKKKKRKKLHLL